MSKPKLQVVRIKAGVEKTALSKEQKAFNKLIKAIDAKKRLLREWTETVPKYNHKVSSEYTVAVELCDRRREELVLLFDRAHGDPNFKKRDRAKLEHIILEILDEFLEENASEALKALHKKYTGGDFDNEQQEVDAIAGEFMKSMFRDMLDVDLGDDVDVSSPDKLRARLEEKLQEVKEREAEEERQAEERRNKRKKSAKQLEKEAKQRREEENVSKSIQEVFRKLAAALHPDREHDPKERERKTGIMQQVNVAYGKRDLLRLLELQLEFEQIDEAHLNQIADGRLKHFNKVLRGQLAELEQEINGIEVPFKLRMHIPPFKILTPAKLMMALENDTREVRQTTATVERDLKTFQDPAALKAWLKNYRIPKDDDFDNWDLDIFGDEDKPFKFR